MAKRLNERQNLALKLDSLDDSEVSAVLEYISAIESRRLRVGSASRDDDLVTLLTDSLENRRARQIFKWESVRRRAERGNPARVAHV